MDDDTLMAKFDAMVLPHTGNGKRDQIVDAINNLENFEDIATFMALLTE